MKIVGNCPFLTRNFPTCYLHFISRKNVQEQQYRNSVQQIAGISNESRIILPKT